MVSAWPRNAVGDGSPAELVVQPSVDVVQLLLAAHVTVAAMARLRRSGYAELVGIECLFCQGKLTLRGNVSSFYLKQVAQTAVRGLEQVEEIINCLDVIRPEE